MYFISIRIFTKKTEVRGELGISMPLITYDIMMVLIIFQVLTRIRTLLSRELSIMKMLLSILKE